MGDGLDVRCDHSGRTITEASAYDDFRHKEALCEGEFVQQGRENSSCMAMM